MKKIKSFWKKNKKAILGFVSGGALSLFGLWLVRKIMGRNYCHYTQNYSVNPLEVFSEETVNQWLKTTRRTGFNKDSKFVKATFLFKNK